MFINLQNLLNDKSDSWAKELIPLSVVFAVSFFVSVLVLKPNEQLLSEPIKSIQPAEASLVLESAPSKRFVAKINDITVKDSLEKQINTTEIVRDSLIDEENIELPEEIGNAAENKHVKNSRLRDWTYSARNTGSPKIGGRIGVGRATNQLNNLVIDSLQSANQNVLTYAERKAQRLERSASSINVSSSSQTFLNVDNGSSPNLDNSSAVSTGESDQFISRGMQYMIDAYAALGY